MNPIVYDHSQELSSLSIRKDDLENKLSHSTSEVTLKDPIILCHQLVKPIMILQGVLFVTIMIKGRCYISWTQI